MVHGVTGVSEKNNTYILAEDLIDDFDIRAITYRRLTAGTGPLYDQATKLLRS
jgi:hypothetical protein